MVNMITHAVIPAAGLGTRFLPATKAQPKEMLPIVDKPAIQFVVEEAVASGIRDILIITGRGKRAIEDHFDKSAELENFLEKTGKNEQLAEIRRISNLADIHYVRQKEQRGLGDAVLCAEKHVAGEPFALLLGDIIVDSEIPCTKQLADHFMKSKGTIVGVQEVEKEDIPKYGIVKPKNKRGDFFEIDSLVEKPPAQNAPSNLAISGRYVLSTGIFEILHATPPGKNGEVQLTDALNALAKKEKVYACKFKGRSYDIGSRLGYASAFADFALRRSDIGGPFRESLKKMLG